MSLYSSFDRGNHFSELASPIDTQSGVVAPAKRRGRVIRNLFGALNTWINNQGPAATSDATAGNRTYTAAEILGGVIVRDCAGAGRSDVLPTAALLVAAMQEPAVGDIVKCTIINGSDAAETITIGAGSGGAFDTNQTAASRVIPQNASKTILIRITNVGTPAYVAYL